MPPAELLDRDQVRALCPYLDFDNARFPIKGALLQRRGGTARHDAVVWGFARGADRRGVDILQNCEVTGLRISNGRIMGAETTRGYIGAGRVGMAVAGNTTRVAGMAGIRLPIESHVLQAFVSEGVKPMIDHVVTFGAGHFYISQSDKGGLVFGGDIDGYNSYAQRGSLPLVEDVMECCVSMVPIHQPPARAARLGRRHGHVDGRLAHHRPLPRRPLVHQRRLVLRRLQGHTRQRLVLRPYHRHRGRPTTINSEMRLDRFMTGALLDEPGTGAQPNKH